MCDVCSMAHRRSQLHVERLGIRRRRLMLASSPLLTELSLGFNSIGNAGVKALVESTDHGALQSLERLYLAGNRIGEAGVDALVVALRAKKLPRATYINLAKNPDAEECVWLVEELLKGPEGYL